MSDNTNSTRWWENYLVRYLVPSIFGIIILRWLDINTGHALQAYLPPFPSENFYRFENLAINLGENTIGKAQIGHEFNTSSLILWMLYGTLYCYLSSYPILVIHAIRKELDSAGNNINSNYKITITITAITTIIAVIVFFHSNYKFLQSIYFPLIVSLLLIYFLMKTIKTREGYNYAKKLAHTRNPKIKEKEILRERELAKDFIDSYKHLREHGNTALIIIMELMFATSIFNAIQYGKLKNSKDFFPDISLVVLIWIIPAALVYFYGHYLEIKFSEDTKFDELDNNSNHP